MKIKLYDFASVRDALSRDLEEACVAFFKREGFDVETGTRFGFFVIDARLNDCRLEVSEAVPEGYNADAVAAHAPQGAQVFFEYHGELSSVHPTTRATLARLWNQLKWQLDLDKSWSPVLAIAAVGPCAVATLPWSELATIREN